MLSNIDNYCSEITKNNDIYLLTPYNLSYCLNKLHVFYQVAALTEMNDNVAWTPSDNVLQTLYRLS